MCIIIPVSKMNAKTKEKLSAVDKITKEGATFIKQVGSLLQLTQIKPVMYNHLETAVFY